MLILDLALHDGDGLDVAQTFLQAIPHGRVLVVTGQASDFVCPAWLNVQFAITNLLRNAVEAIGAAGGGAREIEVRVEPSAEAAVLTVGRSQLGGAEFRIVLTARQLTPEELGEMRGLSRRIGLVWNRAYYARFHAATAVFIARDRRFRKHRGIIRAAHEDLVPEGFLAPEQAVAFEGLYAQRLDADHGDFVDIPREQVANSIETARRFVEAMKIALEAALPPHGDE